MMHRQSQNMMTEQQALQLCSQYGGVFRATKDNIDWWKLPDGTFLGVKKFGNGMCEVRRVSAESCGCS